MAGIIIRNMTHADISQVHAVSQQCFTTPWQLNSFAYEVSNNAAILKVALQNHEIVGYVCLRSILDMTHVLDLAVTPRYRSMGIGGMLMKNALQELRRSKPDITIITLEVRESNIAAIKLYEKFGFKEIGRRIGYYQKPREDAIIMELDMGSDLTSHTVH